MQNDNVDWNEPELVKWISGITKSGTRMTYKSAYRVYAQFTGLNSTHLIDEAIEDMKRDVREKRDVVKTRLLNFYQYLISEYPVSSRGKGEHEIVRKGLRSKTAHMFVNAIRSFYSTFEIYVVLKGRSALPPARVVNKRMDLTTMDVKALIDHVRNPRDRAIILTMFQGGMDVSTLCSIKLSDVSERLRNKEYPLKLELFREKTGTEYYTFLGKDAIDAIRAYLNDVRSKGVELKSNDPLFIKELSQRWDKDKGAYVKSIEPMETGLVQKVLRETAIRCGLVTEENNGHDMNPVSPHALRESFGSIMVNHGVSDSLVDFWLGHKIGDMAEAYKRARFDEAKKTYLEKESFITVSGKIEDIQKIREELGKETEKKIEEETQRIRLENDKLKSSLKELKQIVSEQGETSEQLKKVMVVLMKSPFGVAPNVKPPEGLTDEEFQAWRDKEEAKYEEEWKEAEKFIKEWKKKS